MNSVFDKLFNLLKRGHERSVKAKKNIIGLFLIKGSSIIVGFLMVTVALSYIDKSRYGVWLTVASLIHWVNFFNLGLGSGLRNKLAEAFAVKDYQLAKKYISTAYATMAIITAILTITFIAINPFIDWTKVLNTTGIPRAELNSLIRVVFSCFFIRFFLQLISNILLADQRSALAGIFGPLSNLISLLIIFILTKTTSGSLLRLGYTLSITPIAVFTFFTIYYFLKDYKSIRPSIKAVEFKYVRSIFSLSIKFFLLSISSLILFQSSNILIAQYFGSSEVTQYNIAYKYFGIIQMLLVIILNPFWSAFTNAWFQKDILWVTQIVKKLLRIWALLATMGIVMFIISKWFYKMWVGPEILISPIISLVMLIYYLVTTFGSIFVNFLNGTGKLKLQFTCSLMGALLFFPMTYFFVKVLQMGIEGIIFSTILSNIYGPIIAPIQYRKLINNTASGIWNK